MRNVNGFVHLDNLRPDTSGYYLWAGPDSTKTDSKNGVDWYGIITSPTPFTGVGQWTYLQIITPNGSYVTKAGVKHNDSYIFATGLDGQFPYSSIWASDGTENRSGDSPGNGLTDNVKTANYGDSFATYVMFSPGTSDCQWVPLATTTWYWSGDATQPDPPSWDKWPSGNHPGSITISGWQLTTTHPSWKRTVPPHSF